MVFEWDPRKSRANLRKRGFDFAFAASVFLGTTLEKEDTRRVYGEMRMVAIGMADDVHLTVVYTDRTSEKNERARRVISARKSNKREREAYEKAGQD